MDPKAEPPVSLKPLKDQQKWDRAEDQRTMFARGAARIQYPDSYQANLEPKPDALYL